MKNKKVSAPQQTQGTVVTKITKHEFESMLAWQEGLMKKCGWVIHCVFDDPDYPFNTNIHTHGFLEKFKHPDIQICAPISMDTAKGIIWNLARRLEKGDTFQPNEKYNNILEGYPVLISSAMEKGRKVLRIVSPDQDARFDTEFSKTQTNNLVSNNK